MALPVLLPKISGQQRQASNSELLRCSDGRSEVFHQGSS